MRRWAAGAITELAAAGEGYLPLDVYRTDPGTLVRQISLPEDARCAGTTARFENGMLVLVVPRTASSKPRVTSIPIGPAG